MIHNLRRDQHKCWVYTYEKMPESNNILVACHAQNLNVGDIIKTDDLFPARIIKIAENRNHAGVFKTPEDAVNSFYQVVVTLLTQEEWDEITAKEEAEKVALAQS